MPLVSPEKHTCNPRNDVRSPDAAILHSFDQGEGLFWIGRNEIVGNQRKDCKTFCPLSMTLLQNKQA